MSAQLKERTKLFALDVYCFCGNLDVDGNRAQYVIKQLQRSSSSVAANYRAACRGKSKADFISKLGTVEEEADESAFWLEFIKELSATPNFQLTPQTSAELDRLWDEANQLLAIMVSSKKTARRNL